MKYKIIFLIILLFFVCKSKGGWTETFDYGLGRFQYTEGNGENAFTWNPYTQSLDATFIRKLPIDKRYASIPKVYNVSLVDYGFSTMINITGQLPGIKSDPACAYFGFMNSLSSNLYGAIFIEAIVTRPGEGLKYFDLWTIEHTTETLRISSNRIPFEFGVNYFIDAFVDGSENIFTAKFYSGGNVNGVYIGSLSVGFAPGAIIGFDSLGFINSGDSQQTIIKANFDNFAYIPEPSTILMLVLGITFIIGKKKIFN